MGQAHCLKFGPDTMDKRSTNETLDDYSTPMIKSHQSRRIGCGANKNICQDAVLSLDDWGEDTHLYAVFDGFGPKGREIVEFVRDSLQFELEMRKKIFKFAAPQKDIEKALKETVKAVDDRLKSNKIDISESGCCFLAAIILKHKCFLINLGNLQGIKCVGDPQKSEIFPLTKTHELHNINEKVRVEKAGARIEKLKIPSGESIGLDRFWLGEKGPGFVMTRALGGTNFKSVLIAEPEISFISLSVVDRFILLATDGLWDMMKHEDISNYYFQNEIEPDKNLAELIIKEASKKWDFQAKRPKEYHHGIGDDPTIFIGSDDIALVILQLQFPSRSGREN